MRLFQLRKIIPDQQKVMFNVKGCDPKYSHIRIWSDLKAGLKIHGWCCKVSKISTGGYLYLEIINKRVNTDTEIYQSELEKE